jgi:hypothetical protein
MLAMSGEEKGHVCAVSEESLLTWGGEKGTQAL